MSNTPHIVFAGGGSAGHFHAGLAVAAHVAKRFPEARQTFVGTSKALDRHAIRAAGYYSATIPSQPTPRTPLHAVRFVTDNLAGYWASRWFLKEQDVSLVIGLGGYASAATVQAAAARGIPLVLLEQNVLPGRVTRWMASSAEMVCAGHEEVRPHLPMQAALTITGNPARPAFEKLYRRVQADPTLDVDPTHDQATEKRLVVIGGADGAQSLNESMPQAVRQLGDQLQGWRIVHQTGEGQLQETEQRYRALGIEALVVSFIDEMAPVLFETDVVVCRAGGTTLAELALAGIPALLVPSSQDPKNTDYQKANAQLLAKADACAVIDETQLLGTLEDALTDELSRLVMDPLRRQTMGGNMRSFARLEAASKITEVLGDILYGKARQAA